MLAWTLALAALLALLFARAAVAAASWSRLADLCAHRPALKDRIIARSPQVAAALRFWFWALAAAAVAALAIARPAAPADPRLVALWLAFVAAEVFLVRPLAVAFAERFLIRAWPALDALRALAAPAVWAERWVERRFRKLAGRADPQRELQQQIASYVAEGQREGAFADAAAADMIEGVIELGDRRVGDIMTPRARVVFLRGDQTVEEARAAILASGHSRLPVRGEGDERLLGVLYAKDLLPVLGFRGRAQQRIGDLKLRQPIAATETMRVAALLREMRGQRVHVAIVWDEFGGIAGLATMEDVLEEIVGEIADEHDVAELPDVRSAGDRAWEVAGRVRVAELNEQLPVKLPEGGEYETVAGLLLDAFGRMPAAGETIALDGAHLTVLAAGDRVIHSVRVELSAESEPAST